MTRKKGTTPPARPVRKAPTKRKRDIPPPATEPATEDGFSDKERLFIAKYTEYGSQSFLNGAAAARCAGYSKRSAKVIASQNLTKLNLRAEIDKRLQQFALGPGEVLARLGEHAANVAGTYVKVGKDKKPYIDVEAMMRDGKQHLIKGISYTRAGQVVVELYDAQAALVHVGRYHKLFAERIEHGGKDGEPIQFEDINATRQKRWEGLAPVLELALRGGETATDGTSTPEPTNE